MADGDLLVALMVMWAASTCLLIILGDMYLKNSESFHPHCLDLEEIHDRSFMVVGSRTVCKSTQLISSA